MESWQSIGGRSGSFKGLVQIPMLTKCKNVEFFSLQSYSPDTGKNILSSTEEGRPFSGSKKDLNHINYYFSLHKNNNRTIKPILPASHSIFWME